MGLATSSGYLWSTTPWMQLFISERQTSIQNRPVGAEFENIWNKQGTYASVQIFLRPVHQLRHNRLDFDLLTSALTAFMTKECHFSLQNWYVRPGIGERIHFKAYMRKRLNVVGCTPWLMQNACLRNVLKFVSFHLWSQIPLERLVRSQKYFKRYRLTSSKHNQSKQFIFRHMIIASL